MAISIAIFPPWIKVHFCIKIRITLILKYVTRFFFFICYPSYMEMMAQVHSLAWPTYLFIFPILISIVNIECSGQPGKSQFSLLWDFPSVFQTRLFSILLTSFDLVSMLVFIPPSKIQSISLRILQDLVHC